MLSDLKELQRMRQMDIMDVRKEDIPDIRDIRIDTEGSVKDRVKQVLTQNPNPFFIRFGEIIVKLEFDQCEDSIDDRIKAYLLEIFQNDACKKEEC